MSKAFAWMAAVALLGACGGGDRSQIAADSTDRNLELAPAPEGAALDDRGTDAPEPAPAKPSRPAASRPAASRPAEPATLKLAAGTSFEATTLREISSKTDKAGGTFEARVGSAVKDSRGRTVIPAGSTVTIKIVEIKESENKSDKTGKLQLEPTSVDIGGRSYALDASLGEVPRILRDRKTNAGDIAKVGAGAGAGAIVGRVIGGNTKGAVIGGVLGGAVGTQRAIETQDRDVVVVEGSSVTLTLDAPLTVEK